MVECESKFVAKLKITCWLNSILSNIWDQIKSCSTFERMNMKPGLMPALLNFIKYYPIGSA